MGNHFHLLVRVPEDSAVSDAELLRRASGYYAKKSSYCKLLEQTFAEFGGKLPHDLWAALGSRDFENGVFAEFRDRFGSRRQTGARDLRGMRPLDAVKSLRNLRRAPFG